MTMELTPELQEKKIFLIEGLKKTYKDQYDAIQPLPYVKDRLYCVDKVFVEGGVEVCLAPELTRGTGGSWERLESYKSIYTDFRFKSKRRIIQGEPGYGKSTLTLQLAYDWCNDVSDSPINNVEILILLRLRQLGSVKTLFKAIKSFLLFREPRVSKHEIEKIINSCSSVHITLDGYDEYPGSGSYDTDFVHRIINMELFADFDVSLTTRYLPESLREETKRAKLTGFDDKARDEYIRKAVVGNNDEEVEKIKQRLYENSILADLCQVPLIFVMFAHMAHDQRDFMNFKSVTQFFKHTIRCFYDHLKQKRKLYDDRKNRFYLHEMKHHELDKIAFEGLNKNQQLSWIKTEFRDRVGQVLYDQYILIGILVEEDVVSDDSTVDKVLFTTMVRFYHKLFCEWYAAHHLVTLVKNAYYINAAVRFLDPVDLQYLFRFACGLDPDAGKKLINHLKSLPGGDTFAILCILEQTGDVNDIMDLVKDLCSRDVKIQEGDSALLQRSTTQLLEIASKNDIPISCLHLEYSSIKFEGDTIMLHSGISLPILPTVEEIHIAGSNAQHDNTETLSVISYGNQYRGHANSANQETLTEKDIWSLFRYGMKCRRIMELTFSQLQLPTSISPEAITNILKTRNIRVRWRLFDIDFHLDLQNGHWEVDDIDALRQLCSDIVYIKKSDGILKQKFTVMFIHSASRQEIPIPCLHLDYSSIKFEGDTMILQNGISLPILPTVEKIHIAGSNDNTKTSGISYGHRYGRHDDAQSANHETLTEKDTLNLFRYGMKCRRIKELMFGQLQLPTSVSPEEFTDIMKTRNIPVRWRPFDIDFHLDLQNGHWEVDDIQVILNKNSGTVSLSERNNILQDTSTLQLLEVARNHDVPVSCLHLEYSSIKFEGDAIILHSGIPLPKLPTVEKIHIAGSNAQYGNTGTVTDNNVLILFHYGMKCGRVKEMMFDQLQLPSSFSPEAFTDTMKTKNIQVRWRPFDIEFHLDQHNGHWEVDDIQVILNENSGTVSLSEKNSILQDTSTLQLLEVARNHDIPISCLHLEYSSIKCEGDTIILSSGISLPILPTVEKIHIASRSRQQTGIKRTLTKMSVSNLIHYGMKCGRVKELMFDQRQLLTFFSPEEFTDIVKTQNIQVRWRPFDIEFHWDQQNGHWEVDNIDTLRQLCSDTVHIKKSDVKCKKDDIFKQKHTIMFIHLASSHEIPITCLYLEGSFSKIDDGDIRLNSGLPLSCPVSVKKVVIDTEKGREMAETEVVDILVFVQQSHMLQELEFTGCVLPLSFSSESLPIGMNSRDIKVCWSLLGREFLLNVQSGQWEVKDKESLRQLCSEKVVIGGRDQYLQQWLTIISVQTASYHDIPISCLCLEEPFSKIDDGDVRLNSGLRLSCPVSVKEVVIRTERGKEMTETEVVDILMFVKQSHMLEELKFDGCVLPLTFSSESIPAELQSRNIKVFWSNYGYSLDLQSGLWEVDDVDTVKRVCTEEVNISRHDSELLQRCTIKLLENASYHDISISCLYLRRSFSKIDAGDVILHSGLHLSCPVSVKRVVIQTEIGREMTETEVVDILMFVKQSHMLEKLEFFGCLLPSISSWEAIPAEFKTRDIKVLWRTYGYSLNLQSGAWEVDVDTVKHICTSEVSISRDDSDLKQRCTIQLLENASDHDIPISCLNLTKSFSKIDAGDVILHSGLRLSCPVSVKKVVIDAEEGREMTETEVVDILMFVQQSHMLEELEFFYCLFPQSIPAESIPPILKSRNVKVSWSIICHLNLQSGRLMYCSERHERHEITDTQYNNMVRVLRREWRKTEWQKARLVSEQSK